jgi:hypothetical protein
MLLELEQALGEKQKVEEGWQQRPRQNIVFLSLFEQVAIGVMTRGHLKM